jgi:signal transduction histidine kinase
MKFEDLYALVSEAKGTKPGERYYNVQRNVPKNSEGIGKDFSGVGSSPIGKSDYNPEKMGKIDRWEYNPDNATGYESFEGSSLWNTFKNVFGILMNENFFGKGMLKKLERYSQRRQSINIEDEKGLDNLHFLKSKYIGEEEDNRNLVEYYDTILKLNGVDDVEYQILVSDIESIEDFIKTAKKDLRSKDSEKYSQLIDFLASYERLEKEKLKKRVNTDSDRYIKINNETYKLRKDLFEGISQEVSSSLNNIISHVEELVKKEFELQCVNMSDSDIAKVRSFREERENKRIELVENIEEISEELESIETRINQVNEMNRKSNDEAVENFLTFVRSTAEEIIYSMDERPSELNDLSQLNWSDIGEGKKEKMDALNSLLSDDPNVNPILGYIERFERSLGERDYDASLDLQKNVNIGTVRYYEMLPFSIISKIYKNLLNKKQLQQIKIQSVSENDPKHVEGMEIINKYATLYHGVKNLTVALKSWSDNTIKNELREAIYMLNIPNSNKDELALMLSQRFLSNNRGVNSFMMLKSKAISMMNSAKRDSLKESFDTLFHTILENISFDEDEFRLDLMEVIEEKSKKCTGPTKKASSDRKDKKWTKCAKQPDGSYKRIHWGEAGVRVKKNNPKKRKSFRKRHDCKNAKPGSPNAASCADW